MEQFTLANKEPDPLAKATAELKEYWNQLGYGAESKTVAAAGQRLVTLFQYNVKARKDRIRLLNFGITLLKQFCGSGLQPTDETFRLVANTLGSVYNFGRIRGKGMVFKRLGELSARYITAVTDDVEPPVSDEVRADAAAHIEHRRTLGLSRYRHEDMQRPQQ